MSKKSENRSGVELKCSMCGFIIRPTEKNKAKTPDRLELNKFCKVCNKTVVFNEKK
ncbi:MAG TPA: 50S ribosomal protein L33 [Mollicutes bacterium]|nr:50S ribosomal protein L33 [Mollicutes bacterium]